MSEHIRKSNLSGLVGGKGLLLAVINGARNDFLFKIAVYSSGENNVYRGNPGPRELKRRKTEIRKKHKLSAARFFVGPWYKHILNTLDLPVSYLPTGITIKSLECYIANNGNMRRTDGG